MDIKSFYYFKCVAEIEHMTKAAQKLYVSQAYLSRVIAELEREIGVNLFDRTGRGIALNDSGRVFYEHVVEMISLYSRARHRAQEAHLRKQFQLSVATNAGAYMPDLLTRLSKKSPDIKIRQHSATRRDILSMVKDGVVDFAIVAPPLTEIDFDCLELFDETPVVVYPPGHWLEGFNRVPLAEIVHEPFVGTIKGYGARDTTEKLYESSGFTPTFAVETGDSSSVTRYVANGLGIAVCPKSLILQDPSFKDRYVELEENVACILGLTWLKGRVFDDADELFVKETVDYFRDISCRVNDHEQSRTSGEDAEPNPGLMHVRNE